MGEEHSEISQAKRVYRQRNEGDFPQELTVTLRKEADLKYGENPNQQAALYTLESINGRSAREIAAATSLRSLRSDGRGKGGLSLTNVMDITRGMECLKFFEAPAVVLLKHNVVSGFACQGEEGQSLSQLYRLARDGDRRSNFGCTVVCNRALDQETVDALLELYPRHIVDVVAAPALEEGQQERLQQRAPLLRLADFSHLDQLPCFVGDERWGLFSLKEMPTGRLALQDPYLTSISQANDLILRPLVRDKEGQSHQIEREPTARELADLLTAWYLNIAGARSNGVVFVRRGVLVANGSGQIERVGAIEQALIRGVQRAFDREGLDYDPLLGIQGSERLSDPPFDGAVCASDAFFPFADSIELLARMGVCAVLQPYGSIRDGEVIEAANRHQMAMPATLERCFGHF